jgi:hypothetical protein
MDVQSSSVVDQLLQDVLLNPQCVVVCPACYIS